MWIMRNERERQTKFVLISRSALKLSASHEHNVENFDSEFTALWLMFDRS